MLGQRRGVVGVTWRPAAVRVSVIALSCEVNSATSFSTRTGSPAVTSEARVCWM